MKPTKSPRREVTELLLNDALTNLRKLSRRKSSLDIKMEELFCREPRVRRFRYMQMMVEDLRTQMQHAEASVAHRAVELYEDKGKK